ncbi:hypothetical protein MHLP_02665 [Candidatus Mycoplasma haematolamae str. Purdue]|uniref:Uncharacterized protein n=1 Tax=Mycoplasma haematolamae (strain Purdue) TaxID=1212765 RepID=I7BJR9_MYCHA|nr:hypothetical protein [Candidatus Mycoplasma haematolamae]AFO52113.1 hypothetical protein MHLP_02665 [Candidatus Mycoplasma haematolamae str. Purdue]
MLGLVGNTSKWVLGSALVAGASGGSYAVFGSSGEARDSKVTVFEVLKTDYIPELKIICENKDGKLTVLDVSSKHEDFKFSCSYKDQSEKDSYISKEIKVSGARESNSRRDELSCKPQQNTNQYQCEYKNNKGEVNQKLEIKNPQRESGETESNTQFLRPKD